MGFIEEVEIEINGTGETHGLRRFFAGGAQLLSRPWLEVCEASPPPTPSPWAVDRGPLRAPT